MKTTKIRNILLLSSCSLLLSSCICLKGCTNPAEIRTNFVLAPRDEEGYSFWCRGSLSTSMGGGFWEIESERITYYYMIDYNWENLYVTTIHEDGSGFGSSGGSYSYDGSTIDLDNVSSDEEAIFADGDQFVFSMLSDEDLDARFFMEGKWSSDGLFFSCDRWFLVNGSLKHIDNSLFAHLEQWKRLGWLGRGASGEGGFPVCFDFLDGGLYEVLDYFSGEEGGALFSGAYETEDGNKMRLSVASSSTEYTAEG